MSDNKVVKQEVFVPVEAPKASPGLIVRIIVYVLAVINAVSAMFGFDLGLELDAGAQQTLYDIFSGLFLIASSIHVVWKNNNFTKKARKKEEVAKQIDEELLNQ